MHRLMSGLMLALVTVPLLLAMGCTGSPIGDPCIPESIPPGDGFDSREIYLETSSVQCRTRVCMVYRLNGNPENICDATGGPAGCIDQQVANNRVYCSCRCSLSSGQADQPLCECSDGFRCQDDIVTTGGMGVQGGYCVPCITENDDRNLDATAFENCPVN